jgi:hypothetical protein
MDRSLAPRRYFATALHPNASCLIVTLALVAAGCSTPHMVVPPEIAKDSEVIAVTDRSSMSGALADESFKLGKYAIEDVDRDWDSGSAVGVLNFSSEKTEGGYAYTVKGAGKELKGGCVTEKGDKSFSLGSGMSVGNSFAKLGCTCAGDGEPTKVVISASSSDEYSGELQTHAGTYRVAAIYEAEGSLGSGQPSGYRVDGESARGAVEVLKPGRVWFARDLAEAERSDLACLYAGLLLYMPPDE